MKSSIVRLLLLTAVQRYPLDWGSCEHDGCLIGFTIAKQYRLKSLSTKSIEFFLNWTTWNGNHNNVMTWWQVLQNKDNIDPTVAIYWFYRFLSRVDHLTWESHWMLGCGNASQHANIIDQSFDIDRYCLSVENWPFKVRIAWITCVFSILFPASRKSYF